MRTLVPVALLVLVAACTTASTPEQTATTSTVVLASTTTPTALDLSQRPVVFFAPLPPPRPEFADVVPDGSEDFADLFTPGAAWTQSADRVDVFNLHGAFLRYASNEYLQRVISGVAERGMALGAGLEPLPVPAESECTAGESFSGAYDIELVQRLKGLGGTLSIVALDEPYAFGHKLDGENNCQWSVERVAADVARFVRMLREVFPDVIVGDIEPMWAQPEIGADDMAAWLDAFEAASGEPFGFLHLDADWSRPDWPQVLLDVEEVAHSRGIPVGVIYYGGEVDSDADWLALASEHMYVYEQVWGGSPDHVIFQSWNDHPHRVLPESDPTAFTSLINQYFGERTVLTLSDVASTDPGIVTLEGAIQTVSGDPIPEAELSAQAVSLSGAPQVLSIGGRVPEGATSALIAIRVNTEGAGPGEADLTIYDIEYTQGDVEGNRLVNPRFESGMAGWGAYGDGAASAPPSDRGNGGMLHLSASPDQPLFVDSAPFEVTAGAEYELSTTASIPDASQGVGYISVIFLDGPESSRNPLVLESAPIPIGELTVDASGRFRMVAEGLASGQYIVRLVYGGDLTHWRSSAEASVDVK